MSWQWFPSLFDRPTKIRFAQQEDDEKVELLLRQHWVTNISWVMIATLALLLPPFLAKLAPLLAPTTLINAPENVRLAAILVWYQLVMAYIIEQFLYWYFNVYIVTDKHLIDVDFHSLLFRNVIESKISDVESVSSTVKGVIGELFYFGDVVVQTAAKGQEMLFLSVPSPDFVADRIQDLKEGMGGNDAS